MQPDHQSAVQEMLHQSCVVIAVGPDVDSFKDVWRMCTKGVAPKHGYVTTSGVRLAKHKVERIIWCVYEAWKWYLQDKVTEGGCDEPTSG